MPKKDKGRSQEKYDQMNQNTEISQNEMTSVNGDGSKYNVNQIGTVDLKTNDDFKCCCCIDVPCGATILFVFELMYLVYFIFLIAALIVGQMLAMGEIKLPDGLMNCTTLWKTYGTVDPATKTKTQTYSSMKECQDSAAFKKSQEVTNVAKKNLTIAQGSQEQMLATGEFIKYVGYAMIVCYIPRLFTLCKFCGYQCMSGKKTDTWDDRSGLVMALDALIASEVLSVIATVVITAFVGVKGSDKRLDAVTNNASTVSRWQGVMQILINQGFGIAFTVWWRYDFNKWAQAKKKQKKHEEE